MTKKDYIAIGDKLAKRRVELLESIEDHGPEVDPLVVFDNTVNALIEVFRSDNPAFKESRFRDFVLGKCGPNGGAK